MYQRETIPEVILKNQTKQWRISSMNEATERNAGG